MEKKNGTCNYTLSGQAVTGMILETFQLNGRLLAAGDQLVQDLGLSSARWQVMGALVDGPLPAAQIARKRGLARQSVQRIVDILADEQVVEFARKSVSPAGKTFRPHDTGPQALRRGHAVLDAVGEPTCAGVIRQGAECRRTSP